MRHVEIKCAESAKDISVIAYTSRALISVIFICSFLCLATSPTKAADIVALTSNRDAVLGSAYQSEKQLFVGQSCVVGTTEASGTTTGTFSFDQALSQKDAASELGIAAGGRARFGAVEVSASARFMRSAVSSRYSVSAVWLSEYRTPTEKLIIANNAGKEPLTAIGLAVRNNDERWSQTCGDEYVVEITRGAKLFFSIRIDFVSEEEKKSFETRFQVSGPLASANASFDQASREFSVDTKITVSALQIGGDVSKVTKLFANDSTGRAGFLQCSLGSFKQCAEVVSAALTYATDTVNGFPSQIAPGAKPGPVPITYRSAPYSSVAIYPQNYPYLDQANAEARGRLHSMFEQQFLLAVAADRLIEAGLGREQFERVKRQRDLIDGNISEILGASKICYETPLNCRNAVLAVKPSVIDESVFVLPTKPSASFRIITTTNGIWSREDSVKFMNSWTETWASNPPSKERIRGQRHPTLGDISKDQGASIALYVTGIALKEATLFFENKSITTIPLSGANVYPDKTGDGWAMVVVETTRGNPGWRDVDLWTARRRLWEKDLPQADGVFFLLVRDAFGRSTRFDIEYQKWSRTVTKEATYENFSFRNRWWDPNSNGVSVQGTGDWSSEGTGAAQENTKVIIGPAP